ncbi:MAG: hydantoinase B/oxoprolinase family protein [Acetobacteraceae bacterium]
MRRSSNGRTRRCAGPSRRCRPAPRGYEIATDGLDEPFRLCVALHVAEGEITADYTGTSPQQQRAINCPLTYTNAMTAYAVKCAPAAGSAEQ